MQRHILALAGVLQLVAGDVISATTLFVGGDSPIVETSYAKFQGRDDTLTSTSNYLGP